MDRLRHKDGYCPLSLLMRYSTVHHIQIYLCRAYFENNVLRDKKTSNEPNTCVALAFCSCSCSFFNFLHDEEGPGQALIAKEDFPCRA